MLRGKYIKYSPEITFEVFQKIWDKLIEDGWKEYQDTNIEIVYNNFISEQGVITYSQKNIKTFSNYFDWVIENTDKKLTLSEILGRKLTEFPKEGCCKTTDLLLIKFLDKKYPFSNPIPQKHFSGIGWSNSSFWYLINTEKSSKPLYSLEELKPLINIPTEKYVKIVNSEKSYTNHPDAEEFGCINYIYKKIPKENLIYKVLKITQDYNTTFYALDYNGDHYLINKDGTEPSTKDEYDNQFKTKVTYNNSIKEEITKSWIKDQEGVILRGQRMHELFYKECAIFPKLENYLFGIDPYEEVFNIQQKETSQPIFLKEEETVKTKQINQIKELKFLNIK